MNNVYFNHQTRRGDTMMAITIREQMTAIKAQIDALKAEYSEEYVWGVRWDDADLSVGHIFPASRVWDDGDPTDELCSGTSCIQDTPIFRSVTSFPPHVSGMTAT